MTTSSHQSSFRRIAMWSGPRNISTAMMRSFENRPDTIVVDEPFYGHYLQKTGLDHPGAPEIIASMESDWGQIVAQLTAPLPDGAAIFYQKHMTHHMLPHMSLDWLSQVTNCFLIRDPLEVINSYRRVRPQVSLEDIGFVRQVELFEYVQRHLDPHPPVLDARDVLEHPRLMLSQLCQKVGIEFDERMLSWPAGSRDSDGIWSRYWYAAVERSTGFAPYRPKNDTLPHDLSPVLNQAEMLYNQMAQFKIAPS